MDEINLDKFRDLQEAKKFIEALWEETIKLKKDNAEMKDKLIHAEDLLKNSNVPEVKKMSKEETLLLREIDVIDGLSKATDKGLSMDETKRLKMLVDSLVAIRRKDPVKPEKKKKPISESAAKLLSIAKGENDRQ